MENKRLSLCPNRVTAYLQKEPEELTKADIMTYIKEQGIDEQVFSLLNRE